MRKRTSTNKIKIEELENIMRETIKQLKKNMFLWLTTGMFIGFFISECYFTCKIKNMVYWNQKKIDKIINIKEKRNY